MTSSELILLAKKLRDMGIDPDRIAVKVSPEEWDEMIIHTNAFRRIPLDEPLPAIDRQALFGIELWRVLP